MPCGSLAVQQALLEANVAEELIRSPELRDALQNWLAQLLGVAVTTEISNEWVKGYDHRSVQGDPYVRVTAGGFGLTISVKSGVRLVDYLNSDVTAERIEQFVTALARAAVQERVVAALSQVARVTNDTALAGGLRVLELEV